MDENVQCASPKSQLISLCRAGHAQNFGQKRFCKYYRMTPIDSFLFYKGPFVRAAHAWRTAEGLL